MSQTHLTELFIAKEDGRSTIRLYSAQPTPLEQKNLGQLFAIMEINSRERVNDQVLDMIVDEIDNHYYQTEEFQLEAAFESLLQHVNSKMQQVIAEVGEDWLTRLNMIIGVQRGREVSFTHVGRVTALMVHGATIVNVIDGPTASEIQTAKVFSNIVSGDITDESLLFFATESILDYMSMEKIKRLLQEMSPVDAVAAFDELLQEDTSNTNFAGMIVKRQVSEHGIVEEDTSHIPVVQPGNIGGRRVDSMAELLGKQTETEDLLSSSLWSSVKNSVQARVDESRERKDAEREKRARHAQVAEQRAQEAPIERDPVLDSPARPSGRQAAAVAGTVAQRGMEGAKRAAGWTGDQLKRGSGWVMDYVRNGGPRGSRRANLAAKRAGGNAPAAGGQPAPQRQPRRMRGDESFGQRIGQMLTQLLARIVQWFVALTTIQKMFFVVAVVVFLIFGRSVMNRGETQVTTEQADQFVEIMTQVDAKINDGKAAILFDEVGARDLFIEARDLLAQVPTDADAYAERGDQFAQSIQENLATLNNIRTIDNPTPVLDYSTISPSLELDNAVLLGASVYTFDATNGSVYRGNLESQETSVTISDPASSTHVTAASKASPGTGFVAQSDGTFALFNPVAEAFQPVDLQYPAEASIADVQVFGVRLYTLDTARNQVLRHQQEGDTFASGTEWLTDSSVDLRNAVSFAIDGEIWALKSDGTVARLSGGEQVDFPLPAIDPALSSARTIVTDENTQNLYILDPNNQRVVVFSKTGELVAQYRSDTFTQLKDVIVDEANNRLYVLNGSQLFEIGLE